MSRQKRIPLPAICPLCGLQPKLHAHETGFPPDSSYHEYHYPSRAKACPLGGTRSLELWALLTDTINTKVEGGGEGLRRALAKTVESIASHNRQDIAGEVSDPQALLETLHAFLTPFLEGGGGKP